MRWTVVGLLLLNIMFLIWNWLEYSHHREVGAMNPGSAADNADMPGEHLILLREWVAGAPSVGGSGSPEPVAKEVSPSQTNTESAAVATDARCLLLGPFQESQAAKPLLDRLQALQIEARYAGVEIDGESDYWVYLRPEASREIALLKLKELQEKKIDSFIISQGEMTNAISLGVFDKQENAEKRQQALIELGYDAQIRNNPRSYMENWVVIYPQSSANFSMELYNQLKIDNSKLDLRKDECSKVASPADIH